MQYSSQNVVFGRAFAATVLAAYLADPGAALIVTPKVRLSKNPSFNPTPDSTVAGLEAAEADFSGYTAGGYTPTFSGVVNPGQNIIAVVASILPVRSGTLPGVNNDVYGYWVDDGTNVVLAEAFGSDGPMGFQTPGDFLDLLVAVPFNLLQAAA